MSVLQTVQKNKTTVYKNLQELQNQELYENVIYVFCLHITNLLIACNQVTQEG